MKYFHSISGFPLANNSFIDHVTEAIERILSHKTSKKFSLKVEDLKSATNWLDSEQIVKYLRTKVIMLSLFVPFLSECQNFRRSDIKLFSNYAMIFIEKSKTDTSRDGHWMCIARFRIRIMSYQKWNIS